MNRFQFFDDQKDDKITKSQPGVLENTLLVSPVIKGEPEKYRYRTEQVLLTKFDGVVVNNGTTKREFLVSKQNVDNHLEIGLQLVDNVIAFNPSEMEDAIALLCDIDNIKCNIRAIPDKVTGKIQNILNKQDIVNNWNAYKAVLSDKYDFVNKRETADNINKFIRLVDVQIADDELLKDDIETKLFIELFFDKYLVNKENFEHFTKQFGSQLFEDNLLTFNFTQNIIHENAEFIEVERIGTLDRSKLNLAAIEKQYDVKFKPIINYKFSDFNFEIKHKLTFNTKENVIEKGEVLIIEEVKNNVQIVINYELKRVQV
jgi:hypothetical protein